MPKRRLPHDRAVILMYHSLSGREDYFSSITPEAFGWQMEYLAEHSYSVVPLRELVRRLQNKESLGGSVAITFDDGYRDNFTDAFPILKKYNFPATIFVTTGAIGTADKRDLQRMSAQELIEMESSGLVSIEPHTTSHPRLSQLSHTAALEEVTESKSALESLLKKKCTLFAYPYGDFNTETVQLIRSTGLSAAVTVREGTIGPESDPSMLRRVSVDHTTTAAQFRGKVSTAVDWYERLKI